MRSPWSSSGPVAFFVSLNSYRHHRQHRSARALFFYDRGTAVPTTTTTTTTLALIDNRRVTTTTTTDCLPHDDVIIARYELDDQFSRWRFLQQLLEGDVIPPNDVEDILLLALSAYLRYGPTSNHSSGSGSSSSSSSSSSMLDEKKDKDEDNGGNASPVLTPSQRIVMTDIIESIQSFASSSKDDGSDGIKNDRRFVSMLLAAPNNVENVSAAFDCGNDETMVEVDESALTLLERIEKNLLPDPIDDEDAYMGTWDVIIDLHGRESVRVSEDRLSKERDDDDDDDDDDEEGLRLIRHATSRVVRRKNLQWRTLSSIGRVLIHFDLLTKGVLKEGSFASSSSLSNDK
jgi:hypothetical protein